MKKIWLMVIVLSVVGIAAGFGIYAWRLTNKPPRISPPGKAETQIQEIKLITWDDPAGFTFQYPEGLVVNKHDEDQDNYAHVEFTHKDHPGRLIVWAKDTNAADIMAWVRTEKAFVGASILDSVLGNQPAKKILISSPQAKTILGTIYDELLFMIETEPVETPFWTKIHETVANSFTFKPVTDETIGNSQAGEGYIDEEEVVE